MEIEITEQEAAVLMTLIYSCPQGFSEDLWHKFCRAYPNYRGDYIPEVERIEIIIPSVLYGRDLVPALNGQRENAMSTHSHPYGGGFTTRWE